MATKVNILFFGTLLLVLSCNRALTDTSTPLSDEDVDSTTISNLKDLDTASKETNLSSDVTTPKLTESEENSDAGNSAEEDDDGWEEDETVNIVDQMRELREQGLQVPFEQRTTHINNTFDRLNGAWNVIDQYYLPSRETWVRLLGLVNSLNVPVSPECVASYYQGVGGFTNYDTWAYRFLDVRGQWVEPGTLHGKFSSLGEWDECQMLESPKNSATGLVVKGQYCMLEVKLPFPETNNSEQLKLMVDHTHPVYHNIQRMLRSYRLQNLITPQKIAELLQMANGTIYRTSLCIPAMCKAHEMEVLLNNLTYPIFKLPVQVGPKCYKLNDPIKWETHQVIAMTILTALTGFVILSTVIEYYNTSFDRKTAKSNLKLGNVMFQRDSNQKPNLLFYSFSAITNSRSLINQQSRFGALDSLRFLFVLYIHLYHYFNYLSTAGLVTLKRILSTFPSTSLREDKYAWFRTTLPFEPIFIISGLIVGFNVHQRLANDSSSSSRFNYLGYLVRLWLQFAVTYAGSILFIFVLPTMTRAPVWEYGMSWLDQCLNPRALLTGFFFISNYNQQLGVSDQLSLAPYCNPPTWLASALLQLLCVAPLLVFVAYKLPRHFKYIYFVLLTLLGFCFTFVPYVIFKVKPEVHFLEFETLRETILSHAWYRYGTNTYIGCFVMGLAAGFVLLTYKVLLRQEIETFLAIVSLGLIQVMIAFNNSFWRLDKSPSLFSSLSWYSAIRLLSSFGFTYLFFLISSNRCHTINRALKWRPLQALSRLSYSYFMVHIVVVFYRVFSIKDVYAMDESLLFQNFAIDVMITLALAYFFYCLVECPINNLINWYQGKVFIDIEQYRPKSSDKSRIVEDGKYPNGEMEQVTTQVSYSHTDLDKCSTSSDK